MPEFRTYVARRQRPLVPGALRLALILGGAALAGALLGEAWSSLGPDTPSLLHALRWRLAPWS